MMYGQPQARSYWDGNRFILAPLPQGGLMSPQPQAPQAPAPVAQQSPFQSQISDGGSNTVGGAQTSSAAAPGGFSSSGQANRASSPSANSPSMASLGGLVGTGASLATGFMGLGSALSAVGGAMDAKSLNADLAAIGHGDKSVGVGAAALNSALMGAPDALGIAGPKTDMASMGIGLSPRGASDLAGFARGYDGMGLTGFDSPEMDAALGLSMASPLSVAMSPAGLLSFSGYSPGITSLGSPGLGGYGNLGTEHSYGFDANGNLVGNFTGNETGTQGQGGGGGGAMGGHGGQGGEGFGGSDPDGNGNWAKGGPVPTVKRDTVRGPDDQYITVKSGEYVIRPEAVAHYGRGLLDALNSGRIPKGLLFG